LDLDNPESVNIMNEFAENLEIESFNTMIRTMNSHSGLESLRIFIERNGRPFNYLTNPDLLMEKHNEYYKEQEDVRLAEISVEEAKKLQAIEAAKSARLERALKQVKFIEDNECTMGEEAKGVR
jgi:Ser-tRNA(Ala) deacylase AlaX